MADVFSKGKRSKIMSSIKAKNNSIDRKLWALLRKNNIEFKKYAKIHGTPDAVISNKKIAIFCDGCFWHGCSKHYKEPRTRTYFWKMKIKRNKKRDSEVSRLLKDSGYKVIRVWEHEIEENPSKSMGKIIKGINKRI